MERRKSIMPRFKTTLTTVDTDQRKLDSQNSNYTVMKDVPRKHASQLSQSIDTVRQSGIILTKRGSVDIKLSDLLHEHRSKLRKSESVKTITPAP